MTFLIWLVTVTAAVVAYRLGRVHERHLADAQRADEAETRRILHRPEVNGPSWKERSLEHPAGLRGLGPARRRRARRRGVRLGPLDEPEGTAMSAELLRRAAETLRQHAEAATPGWYSDAGRIRAPKIEHLLKWDGKDPAVAIFRRTDDEAYVGLMHPSVGLLLADLFDTAADAYEGGSTQDLAAIAFEAVSLAGALLGEVPA